MTFILLLEIFLSLLIVFDLIFKIASEKKVILK